MLNKLQCYFNKKCTKFLVKNIEIQKLLNDIHGFPIKVNECCNILILNSSAIIYLQKYFTKLN